MMRSPWATLCVLLVALAIADARSYREFDWQKEWFETREDKNAQDHYKKNKAQVNDEAKEQGRAYACGACQTIARVVGTMVGSKMKEKEMKDFFMEMCDTAEPSKRLNPEDTKVICRRIVTEHLSDIIDAVSVGEGYEEVCKEADLCDGTHKETMEGLEKYQKELEKQKKKEEKKRKRGGSKTSREEL